MKDLASTLLRTYLSSRQADHPMPVVYHLVQLPMLQQRQGRLAWDFAVLAVAEISGYHRTSALVGVENWPLCHCRRADLSCRACVRAAGAGLARPLQLPFIAINGQQ
jgi:hypothetical protein